MIRADHDLLIIGGGPAGYTAAIRAAQLGRKVALVEEDKLGGECTNYACIPSKALISAANLLSRVSHFSELGLITAQIKPNWQRIQSWKDEVVSRLVKGLEYLMSGYGVDVIKGKAKLVGERRAVVQVDGKAETVNFQQAILATGSEPVQLPELPFDAELVISSKEAVHLRELPERLLIVGGGIVGVELGTMFAKLGVGVTIVEMMPQLLPGMDSDLVRPVHEALRARGAAIYTGAKLLSARKMGKGLVARIQTQDGVLESQVDKVLVSVGRRPRVAETGAKELGVALNERGAVKVDRQMRTSLPWLFAAGDVIGPPYLAHKAYAEAHVAAEAASGRATELSYVALPDVVFSDPEIARVGLGEEEARRAGRDIVTGRYSFSALGKGLTDAETSGFVKVVADVPSHRILGISIVGPHASDLIAEAALALELGLSLEDLALVVHAHPTFAEALREAAASAAGMPHHQLRLKA